MLRDATSHLCFLRICIFFKGLQAAIRPAAAGLGDACHRGPASRFRRKEICMGFHYFAGAACRALTARKDGPSLYDVCDPLLLKYRGGDPHLGKFYRTALGNPALRPLLRRTGLPALRDETRLAQLREALTRARDDAEPDWAAVGAPDRRTDGRYRGPATPSPPPAAAPGRAPERAEIERMIRRCGAHLLRSFARNGFIPTYAAFNLIGDADMGGRELLMALTGLNSRGYKNSTLLFNLARIFIAHSPARALINPPWRGIAEPMWQPMQIRHRSAYYDAFFTEALLSFVETGLASPDEAAASRRAIADMVDFCLKTSREEVPSHDGSTVQRHHRAGAAAASALLALLRPDQAGSRLRHLRAGLRHHGVLVLGGDAGRLDRSDPRAAAAGFLSPATRCASGANEPRVTVPLNDNIDYEGGVVTWIDNLAGERPYGNDLDPTLNLDILEVSFRNLARWKILETPQRLETVHRIIGFQRRLVGKRRVHQSALAHLLSAGTLLRLFRPLLCRVHGVARGGAAGDRSGRRVRFHPRQGAGLCRRTN